MKSGKPERMNMKFWEYTAKQPYPPIKVEKPNLKYAKILMDDYAGIISEFTAISQYLYHHFLFKYIDQDLAELLEGIAIVEMHHMEMLAETIILLGGDPKIRGSYSTKGHYWYGDYVNYGTSLCDKLFLDLKSELKAIKNYKKDIKLIDDPYIKATLHRIILDEKRHVALFNEQIDKFNCRME